MSLSDLLGSQSSSPTSANSSLVASSSCSSKSNHPSLASFSSISSIGCDDSSPVGLLGGSLVNASNPFTFGGLRLSSPTLNSPEIGSTGSSGGGGDSSGGGGQSPTGSAFYNLSQSTTNFDEFRFDTDAVGCSSANLSSESLKLRRRNISYDCSSPTTLGTPTSLSLCPRGYRSSATSQQQQHFTDLNGSFEPNSSSSLFSSNPPLSRSNTPPQNETNLLASLESTSILDMLNYLTVNQQQQQSQSQAITSGNGHQSQFCGLTQTQQQSQYSQQSQISSLNSLYLQQQQQQLQQQQQQQQLHQQPQQQLQQLQQTTGSAFNSISTPSLSNGFSNDYERLQQLQTLNTLRLLHQSQLQLQQYQFNQLLPGYNGNSALKNWSNSQVSVNNSNGNSDLNLDRIARFHRSSAAHYDATCTWSGVLPPRSHRLVTYSSKIFLGGMPWDISEQSLVQIFKPFGSIKVEWPGKEQQATQPKGYVYIIFESDKQVKALLQACTYTDSNCYNSNRSASSSSSSGSSNYSNSEEQQQQQQQQQLQLAAAQSNKMLAPTGARMNFKISSKRIKSKDVEVIPWNIADSNYVKSTSQKLDPTKTVFVGALHGQLTAEGLAKIMNDLFDGVVYVGIDTDKYKYPLGSARVTFNNSRSYMKAVVAAFIEIRTAKFTKKLQVDPYLEDSLCSMCGVQHGPYFCRETVCFRYFCRSCWQFQHNREVYLQNHKPLTRNSKSTAIIGVGPQQHQLQHHLNNSNGSVQSQQHAQNHHYHHHYQQNGNHHLSQHYHQSQQQQQQQQHGSRKSPSPPCTSTSTSSSSSSDTLSEQLRLFE